MHPRRFTRVRPTGRNADVAKLIVGPKDPVIDCRVVDYSPEAPALRSSGSPICLVDLCCSSGAPRNAAGLSGAAVDVWGSLFDL